ncbi:extracellular tyrosine-protein kinase PKDCC-like isoform X2 [Physella acuta]|uniref:extracellular tyrosine-protein kinase PKDCC-like isoform X2 n=1 Tax=Physella acuta TaxID=109671 RepID=UPI0027DBA73C|nr:extracellular tyrosine-protein kinase PKDCC-like isoform X2 [Physella acuta]
MTSPQIRMKDVTSPLYQVKVTSPCQQLQTSSTIRQAKLYIFTCLVVFSLANLVLLQVYHVFVVSSAQNGGPETNTFSNERNNFRKSSLDTENGSYSVNKLTNSEPPLGQILNDNKGRHDVLKGHIRKLMGHADVTGYLKWFYIATKEPVPKFVTFGDFKSSVDSEEGMDLLTCSDIEEMQEPTYVARGWTKVVHKGVVRGRHVAVKTVDAGGRDVQSCLDKGGNVTGCYNRAAAKIVKEIQLLKSLVHENVVKVLGFCISPTAFDADLKLTVAMVTELGEPIDLIRLLQMTWEDRLRISYDVTKLIQFLSSSPRGSLALNDFQRTQFVLVNGSLKLSDVDDADFGEQACASDDECLFKLECVHGHCKHQNEYANIMKTGRYFISVLLPFGAPASLQPLIDTVLEGYENLTMNTDQLLRAMDEIVGEYQSGRYLGENRLTAHDGTRDYHLYTSSDLPGQYDYRCRLSMSSVSCTLSVFDLLEAQHICDRDSECQGFIWTQQKTWTGRTLVHFKNGITSPSSNQLTDLYIKGDKSG